MRKVPTLFTRFAKATARIAGRPQTFTAMALLVVAWAAAGPYFGYSDTWQLTINTGTTILTFLMVFLIQATQNRDAEAIQIKLDEIIRSLDNAHNSLLDLEELEEEDLLKMRANYLTLAERARSAVKQGKSDTGVPEIDEPHQKAVSRIEGGERKPR
jgi:low affinity Fe/Cu permease